MSHKPTAGMTKEQIHILQHSLGVDKHGRGQMYRNFYYTYEAEPVCESLVALGYMEIRRRTALYPGFNYSVTDAGKIAMLTESPKPPKLTASQKRYREFHDSGASDCGYSFGEWPKDQKLRNA